MPAGLQSRADDERLLWMLDGRRRGVCIKALARAAGITPQGLRAMTDRVRATDVAYSCGEGGEAPEDILAGYRS